MRVAGRAVSALSVAGLVVLSAGAMAASIVTAPSARTTPAANSTPTSTPPTSDVPGNVPLPETYPGPRAEVLQSVFFLDPTHGYGLFAEPDAGPCPLALATTDDGGDTFSARHPISSSSCTGGPALLHFDGVGDGFLVAGPLFVSHDNGTTWSADTNLSSVVGIAVVGTSVWVVHGACSGPDGTSGCGYSVATSPDGGRTWSDEPLPEPQGTVGYAQIVGISSSSALVLGEPTLGSSGPTPGAVALMATTDGGHSWQQRSAVPCVGIGWVVDLSRAPDGSLWLGCGGEPSAGQEAKSFAVSTDGGYTWAEEPCHTDVTSGTIPECVISSGLTSAYLGEIVALSSTTALLDGGRNWVKITHDGGATWSTTQPLLGGDGAPPAAGMYFVDTHTGWIIFGNTTTSLWRTDDAGTDWHQIWPADTSSSTCSPAQLRVSTGAGVQSKVFGNEAMAITFTNVSGTPCSIGGYPSVVAVDDQGRRVSARESPQGSVGGVQMGEPLPLVPLAPGAEASAVIESAIPQDPGQPCPAFSYLLVTAPGTESPVRVSAELPGLGADLPDCPSSPDVHPIVPGPSGSG